VMTDPIEIRRASVSDESRLKAFAAEIWPSLDPSAFVQRWWMNTSPGQCFVAIATGTGRVEATCAGRKLDLHVEGKTVPAVGLGDWFTTSRVRGKGVGRAVAEAAMDGCRNGVGLSSSDTAIRGLSRLGWHPVPPMRVAVFAGGPPALARALGGTRKDRTLTTRDLTFTAENLSMVGVEFDRLWDGALSTAGIGIVRNAATLREHLRLVPHRRYHMSQVLREGELIGYVLGRDLPGRGRISLLTDFLCLPQRMDAFRVALQAWLSGAHKRRRFAVLTVCTAPEYQDVLSAHGFLSGHRRGFLLPISRLSTTGMHTLSLPAADAPDAWQLTPLDADFDLALRAGLEAEQNDGLAQEMKRS